MRDDTIPAMMNVGKCVGVEGDVFVRSPILGDGPLVRGAYIQVEDQILTRDNSYVHIQFLDNSKFALSAHSQLSIDAFSFAHENNEDAAHFTIPHGKFVCISGEIASNMGSFTIQARDTSFSLKGARIAGRIESNGEDIMTLLPQLMGPAGEVLAHSKAAVASIDRAYQTLRFGGAGHGLSTPLTLPSQVVIDTYAGPGLERAFVEPEPDEADLIDLFQPFDVLSDHFLERQFVSTHVYPNDIRREETSNNELLEDSFVGERFRLKDRER